MALLGGDSNVLGIDIGSSGIRIVQLKHGGGQPLLVTYGDVELPLSLTQSDAPMDKDKLAEALQTLLAEIGASTKQAVVGIPSMKVYATIVTLPRMHKNELANGIKYEAEQHVPMPLDQLKLDWSILNDDGQSKTIDVLVVATPHQTAHSYQELCVKSGIQLVGLEPTTLSIGRALVSSKTETVLVVDMGGLTTDVSIIHQDMPRSVGSISVGGFAFSQAVAQYLGVNLDQAKQFIEKFGLTTDKLEGQVFTGIKPVIDSMIGELQKIIQQFSDSHGGIKPSKVVLTGKSSSIPQFPAYLATGMALPVEIGNPWAKISYPADIQEKLLAVADKYAVAAGLAQMEVE